MVPVSITTEAGILHQTPPGHRMHAKVDYNELEREYVTGDISVRELARRYDMSNGTISAQARKREWESKRASYRDSIARRSYEKTADRFASKQVEVNEEIFGAMRATIYKYVEALKENKIIPSTKDAAIATDIILRLFGEPTERMEARVLGINVTATGSLSDPDLLRRLEALTRGALPDDEPSGTPRLRIAGSSD